MRLTVGRERRAVWVEEAAGPPRLEVLEGLEAPPRLGLESAMEAGFGHATHRTQARLAAEVTPVGKRVLAERGVAFSPPKTRITHLAAGFDWLGVQVRKEDGTLVSKPSHTSVQGVLTTIGTVRRRNWPAGDEPWIGMRTPSLTGWAHAQRPWVCQETGAQVAHELERNAGGSKPGALRWATKR